MEQPSQAERIQVVDQEGVRGFIEAKFLQQPEIHVTFGQNRSVLVPTTLLSRQQDGSYHLPLRFRDLDATLQTPLPDEAVVVPVIQEEAQIGKRRVESGRVRFTKVAHARQETVDVPLSQESVQVERIPVDRILEAPVSIHYDGETLVIPVMEEVLVVEKRLILKEEVRVTKVREEKRHQETLTLRNEEISIVREKQQGVD